MIRALARLAPLALGAAACAPSSPLDLIPPEDLALIEAAERRDAAEAEAAALRAQAAEADFVAARNLADAAAQGADAATGDIGSSAERAIPSGDDSAVAAGASASAEPISVDEMLARVRRASGAPQPAATPATAPGTAP